MSMLWATAFLLSESMNPLPRSINSMTCPLRRKSASGAAKSEGLLKKLAVPAVATHEGHVDLAPVALFSHAATVVEYQAKVIYRADRRMEGEYRPGNGLVDSGWILQKTDADFNPKPVLLPKRTAIRTTLFFARLINPVNFGLNFLSRIYCLGQISGNLSRCIPKFLSIQAAKQNSSASGAKRVVGFAY
jgi:hypothetical protein